MLRCLGCLYGLGGGELASVSLLPITDVHLGGMLRVIPPPPSQVCCLPSAGS